MRLYGPSSAEEFTHAFVYLAMLLFPLQTVRRGHVADIAEAEAAVHPMRGCFPEVCRAVRARVGGDLENVVTPVRTSNKGDIGIRLCLYPRLHLRTFLLLATVTLSLNSVALAATITNSAPAAADATTATAE